MLVVALMVAYVQQTYAYVQYNAAPVRHDNMVLLKCDPSDPAQLFTKYTYSNYTVVQVGKTPDLCMDAAW